MLTHTQQALLMILAAEAGWMFMEECQEALSTIPWDGPHWEVARRTLRWIDTLPAPDAHEAKMLYSRIVSLETGRLMDVPWRVVLNPSSDGRQWSVEPKGYDLDTPYSPVFASRAAAEAWAQRHESETKADAHAPGDLQEPEDGHERE